MEPLSTASLVGAVIAAGVAIWQGVSSHRQLDLARRTEDETKRARQEIRDLSRDIRTTATEIKSTIDERITKILDLRLDAERQEMEAKRASAAHGADLANQMFGWFGKQVWQAIAEQDAGKHRNPGRFTDDQKSTARPSLPELGEAQGWRPRCASLSVNTRYRSSSAETCSVTGSTVALA